MAQAVLLMLVLWMLFTPFLICEIVNGRHFTPFFTPFFSSTIVPHLLHLKLHFTPFPRHFRPLSLLKLFRFWSPA